MQVTTYFKLILHIWIDFVVDFLKLILQITLTSKDRWKARKESFWISSLEELCCGILHNSMYTSITTLHVSGGTRPSNGQGDRVNCRLQNELGQLSVSDSCTGHWISRCSSLWIGLYIQYFTAARPATSGLRTIECYNLLASISFVRFHSFSPDFCF